MNKIVPITALLTFGLLSHYSLASDFAKLDEALPPNGIINNLEPVFDFDGDGCLPSAGISRAGEQNAGLKTSGTITGGCRSGNFLLTSNTLHRYVCKTSNGDTYCGHFYALYFEKDQLFHYFGGGHRHDWEHAAVWTKNGVVTHGSYSAHGDLYTKPAAELPFENGHLKIVYHKDGITTHAFRFAKSNEYAENPYGSFLTPTIISWYQVTGDGLSNEEMRNRLNSYDYGSATIPMKDSNFLNNINDYRPSGYPTFTSADVSASQ
ncbi:sugar-binding protein [Hahella sp. CCB-MM4]|uniref:NPP1 family protein n=1 Tax=Hahella sp. (strain CCB-MM4) TaxID=1926491 RepID=UPI000B9A51A3|nr:NPP1 family protein [Hahella sp. CCB-MM4]OZG75454.1 sugar-binding protein [Hahella sp. CCB-MM4]